LQKYLCFPYLRVIFIVRPRQIIKTNRLWLISLKIDLQKEKLMKTRKCIKVGLMVLIVVMGGLILNSSQALAQTQGDVAIKLATLLGLDSSSAENAIAALTAVGIVLTWNSRASATEAFIGALYAAVNSAIEAGKITPPSSLPNASALFAAAATAAGLPSQIVVKAIVAAGGNRDLASTGASYGVSLAATPPGGFVGHGAGYYGVGGGGGGVASPSR
jgi:hypothetical protein